MILWLMIVWSPAVLALVLAVTVRLIWMRATPHLGARVAVLSLLAGAIPAIVTVVLPIWAYLFSRQIPVPVQAWLFDLSFRTISPLALGAFAVILLAVPSAAPRTGASADVRRRTVFTFVRPGWVIQLSSISAITVGLAIAAGAASRPDTQGRYTEFWMPLGSSGTTRFGTTIYGWYYSVPGFFTLGALLLLTALAWWFIARPSWGDDVALDRASRSVRADNVGRAAGGAALLHLGAVLNSVAGTLGLRGETSTTELGMVSVGTPLAGLQPVLFTASLLISAIGLALWMLIGLSAIPSRTTVENALGRSGQSA